MNYDYGVRAEGFGEFVVVVWGGVGVVLNDEIVDFLINFIGCYAWADEGMTVIECFTA